MGYIKSLQCFLCEKEFNEKDIRYTCPSCGGNLNVLYYYEEIRKFFSPDKLKNNTDYTIWRYLPILPFSSPEKLTFPSLPVGWTPLHKAKNIEKKYNLKNLYLKDDTKTPSASFKDRASAVVILKGQELGMKIFTAASTGNAGCALACLCANLNYPCVIFVPETAPKAKIAQLLIFGAKVLAVKGTYDDAFDLSLAATEKFGWYCRSTGYNPYTREGKKTAAYEIVEQLSWKVPDKVFVPIGDGNIISGIWKGFRDFYELGFIDRLPQLVGVQSKLSNAVSLSVKKLERKIYSPEKGFGRLEEGTKIEIQPVKATTIADSISVDMPRDGVAAVKAIIESKGFVIEVSDEEILESIKILATNEGIFSEPAGATSFAGLKKMFDNKNFNPEETVVCLVTGNGLKDVNSATKVVPEPIKIHPEIEELEKLHLF